MTIEQPSVPENVITDDSYTKIEEVTGIKDKKRIDNAISTVSDNAGAYEIEEVIQVLVTEPFNQCTEVECYMATGEVEKSSAMCNSGAAKSKTVDCQIQTDENKKNVIDLTNEGATPDEAIQKAIAESLKENSGILGGQISREEQEISRVLEQSLQENKIGNKRKRGDIWFVDPVNPNERKRDSNWPVGLKNVGNTCWFSAVVQSLFHLPVFRKLVLNFSSPAMEKEGTQEKRNLLFMEELRHLFALMIGSKRKYIDPSKPVDILKEAFSGGNMTQASDTGQQDVSEFQHKLLEWLEDAFRENLSDNAMAHSSKQPDNEEKETNNPMKQLFYGQFMSEGVLEGTKFTNKEPFGQFPLQVAGFENIHESLEAGTAEGEIETGDSSTAQSGQEHWFTKLAPVLTFELSRFQFNQELNRPEKIHNILQFPEMIFLDRYLDINKSITRQKRQEVKKIKEELQVLQQKLDRFVNYGTGSKQFPLQDVLQYTLEFAQSKESSQQGSSSSSSCTVAMSGDNSGFNSPACLSGSSVLSPSHSLPSDMEVESPKSVISVHSPDITSGQCFPPDVVLSSPRPQKPSTPSIQGEPQISSTQTLLKKNSYSKMDCETPTPSPSKVSRLEMPSPKHVSQHELVVLQSCLKRWKKEVENDVKELQDSINTLEESIGNMYSDENLKKVPYRLHAVLVHEGQAASGHYWAYVYSEQRQKWLKFNDVTVTESKWEELTQDSFGGYHNASAYCLMYVDCTRNDLLQEDVDNETGQSDILPVDLQKFVNADNACFEKEIQEWNHRQTSNEVQCVGESKSSAQVMTVTQKLAQQHANLLVKQSVDLIHRDRAGVNIVQDMANDVLKEVCQAELQNANSIAQRINFNLPLQDQRLESILVFLFANDLTNVSARNRILFEQFGLPAVMHEDDNTAIVAMAAKKQIQLLANKATDKEEELYADYHDKYASYRKVVSYFVSGFEYLHHESYIEALSLLCNACEMNRALTFVHTNPKVGVQPKLLNFFRRQCLLHLNEQTCVEFEKGEDLERITEIMNKLLLPCVSCLTFECSSQEDESAVEDVRERWCSFLNLSLPEKQHEKLQEFLSKMFDPPTEYPQVALVESRLVKDCDLLQLYNNVINVMQKSGYLEKLLQSQS